MLKLLSVLHAIVPCRTTNTWKSWKWDRRFRPAQTGFKGEHNLEHETIPTGFLARKQGAGRPCRTRSPASMPLTLANGPPSHTGASHRPALNYIISQSQPRGPLTRCDHLPCAQIKHPSSPHRAAPISRGGCHCCVPSTHCAASRTSSVLRSTACPGFSPWARSDPILAFSRP